MRDLAELRSCKKGRPQNLKPFDILMSGGLTRKGAVSDALPLEAASPPVVFSVNHAAGSVEP